VITTDFAAPSPQISHHPKLRKSFASNQHPPQHQQQQPQSANRHSFAQPAPLQRNGNTNLSSYQPPQLNGINPAIPSVSSFSSSPPLSSSGHQPSIAGSATIVHPPISANIQQHDDDDDDDETESYSNNDNSGYSNEVSAFKPIITFDLFRKRFRVAMFRIMLSFAAVMAGLVCVLPIIPSNHYLTLCRTIPQTICFLWQFIR
jgi:hypothetical protein